MSEETQAASSIWAHDPAQGARYRRMLLVLTLCVACVLAIYVLILTTSAWARRAQAMAVNLGFTDYYDQLATSFLQGQLYRAAQPDPALLALPDPYPPGARAHIPY